jgi:dihydrofolate synthase/folylpolyglutamate synthase
MLRMLAPRFDRVFFSQPKLRRAASAARLRRIITRGEATRSIEDALSRARRAAGAGGEVVVAGSVFVVAEARARVLGLRTDPLIRM